MSKLMTAATVILSLVMIVITTVLSLSATNGAAVFVLLVLNIGLAACILVVLDWGNGWHKAAQYAKDLMEGSAARMASIKENAMSYCEKYCPLPMHTCGLEEDHDGSEFIREECLNLMLEEVEAAQEMMDEHYVGAHEGELQVGCPTCDAIRSVVDVPAPPTDQDAPF